MNHHCITDAENPQVLIQLTHDGLHLLRRPRVREGSDHFSSHCQAHDAKGHQGQVPPNATILHQDQWEITSFACILGRVWQGMHPKVRCGRVWWPYMAAWAFQQDSSETLQVEQHGVSRCKSQASDLPVEYSNSGHCSQTVRFLDEIQPAGHDSQSRAPATANCPAGQGVQPVSGLSLNFDLQ